MTQAVCLLGLSSQQCSTVHVCE